MKGWPTDFTAAVKTAVEVEYAFCFEDGIVNLHFRGISSQNCLLNPHNSNEMEKWLIIYKGPLLYSD